MAVEKSILVTRAQPGLGDIFGSSVAMRAAHEKYSPLGFRVFGSFGLPIWRELFEDQTICDGILECDWCRMNPDVVKQRFVHHFSLDGPERMHEQDTQWNIQRPRVETWCMSVDHVPSDMRPRWKPRPDEREWAVQYLASRGLVPGEFAVLHFAPDLGMPHKWYPKTVALATGLSEKIPVLVLHKFGPASRRTNQDQFSCVDMQIVQSREWEKLREHEHDRLRVECNLNLRQLGAVLGLAYLGIGPDSSILHFAAAVDLRFIGIFGATSGSITCRPYGSKSLHVQAPISPTWLCHDTAPCSAVRERNFWCHSNPQSMAECLGWLAVDTILEIASKNIGAGESRERADQTSRP